MGTSAAVWQAHNTTGCIQQYQTVWPEVRASVYCLHTTFTERCTAAFFGDIGIPGLFLEWRIKILLLDPRAVGTSPSCSYTLMLMLWASRWAWGAFSSGLQHSFLRLVRLAFLSASLRTATTTTRS